MSEVDSKEKQSYWCNFCDFRTEDRTAYLAHSCAKELSKEGHRPDGPGGEKHCR